MFEGLGVYARRFLDLRLVTSRARNIDTNIGRRASTRARAELLEMVYEQPACSPTSKTYCYASRCQLTNVGVISRSITLLEESFGVEAGIDRKTVAEVIPAADHAFRFRQNIRSSRRLLQSGIVETSPVHRVIWPSACISTTSSVMGSIEQQSENTFQPISLKEFESVFPQLVEEMGNHCKQYGLPENALQWYMDV